MFIIRLNSTTHPRYLNRSAEGNTWVVSITDATLYETAEQTLDIISNYLAGFSCETVELSD